jgi:hypothetical protein
MNRTVMAGVLALASWTAQADQGVPGWRVGVAASFADFQWDNGPVDVIDDSSVGAKLYTQYQLSSWLGVEGAYHNTGEFSDDVVTSNDPNTPPGAYDLSFNGFSVAAIGYLPLGLPEDEIQFYAKAGYYDFDDKLSLEGAVTSNGSENGLMAGAGATIAMTERFGLRVDLDWFDAEVGDLWSANLGLEYFFGGPDSGGGASTAPPPPPPPPPSPADDAGSGDDAGAATEPSPE